MTLYERIQMEATNQNMTLAALERDAKLGNGTIRRWDINSPSVEKLSRVANLLNVSLDYLYFGINSSDTNLSLNFVDKFQKLFREDQEEVMDIIDMKLSRSLKRKISSET